MVHAKDLVRQKEAAAAKAKAANVELHELPLSDRRISSPHVRERAWLRSCAAQLRFARCRRVTRLTKFAAAAATDKDGQEICEPCLTEAGVLLTADNFMSLLPAQDVDDLFDRLADATVQGANINQRLSTIAKSFTGFVVTVPTLCTIALNSIGRLATRAAQADLASALRQVARGEARGGR